MEDGRMKNEDGRMKIEGRRWNLVTQVLVLYLPSSI